MASNYDFLLERYKFILAQKQTLNRNTFVAISIYQASFALIVYAQFTVLTRFYEGSVSAHLAATGSALLLGFLFILSFFLIALIAGGIASWLNYRSDEADIEREMFGRSRRPATLSDAFKWYESYVLLAILFLFVTYCFVYFILIRSVF